MKRSESELSGEKKDDEIKRIKRRNEGLEEENDLDLDGVFEWISDVFLDFTFGFINIKKVKQNSQKEDAYLV